jgi:hypothetical protein
LKKGEGASLKTPALAGEKSATLTLCLFNLFKGIISHNGGLLSQPYSKMTNYEKRKEKRKINCNSGAD